jgi:hypothetical protein
MSRTGKNQRTYAAFVHIRPVAARVAGGAHIQQLQNKFEGDPNFAKKNSRVTRTYILTVPQGLKHNLEDFHNAFERFFLEQSGFKNLENGESNAQLEHAAGAALREQNVPNSNLPGAA